MEGVRIRRWTQHFDPRFWCEGESGRTNSDPNFETEFGSFLRGLLWPLFLIPRPSVRILPVGAPGAPILGSLDPLFDSGPPPWATDWRCEHVKADVCVVYDRGARSGAGVEIGTRTFGLCGFGPNTNSLHGFGPKFGSPAPRSGPQTTDFGPETV